MRAVRTRRCSAALAFFASLVLTLLSISGCSQKSSSSATGPATSFGGTVTLAAGTSGDVNGTKIDLYYSDPFAVGATIALTTTATGSATLASFSFGSLAAGDFYVVASKGTLSGWFDGARNGSGNPVASVIEVLHGDTRTINITLH